MRRLLRQKPFSEITIQEICEHAHIGRRTFYHHYSDKYALLRDVYLECFFLKLEISESDGFWDVIRAMCFQIYEEQDFFTHAFKVKGQNGFWEETGELLFPYAKRNLPTNLYTDKSCEFYVRGDIYVIFQLIEQWISDGFRKSATEFYEKIKTDFAIHGKWMYQLAMGYSPEEFTPEKLEKKEW